MIKATLALKQALPEAEERISWSMPTYWKKHNILHFAASKKHIGFYPGSEAVAEFKEALKNMMWIKEPYAFHMETLTLN